LTQHELAELLKEMQPDILHSHDAGLLGIQLARFAGDTRIPVMASCHYVPHFVSRFLAGDGELSKPLESLVWSYSLWLYNHYDHVVYATESHRSLFVQEGLETPTTLISNGIDLGRYFLAAPDPALARRYELPHGFRILFVGRLMVDKEIDVLIQAMEVVRAEVDAHLLVVGTGDEQPSLEELTAELGLGDAIHFLGFVPEEDLPALYRHMDCFAIASVCEVQSLPTLQALATGMPVVAADALALPELVHHGENGFLVPPGEPQAVADALLALARDSDLAQRMAERGLEIVRAHDETRTFDLYEGVYRELVAGG
jgi:glycosyltransferase involved in cell wall biosynthesis